jgi:ComF family protein
MTSTTKIAQEILTKINDFFLDILFPIVCVSCKAEGNWLCANCSDKIHLKCEQVCGFCEKVTTPQGRTCQACRKKTSLDGLIVCASYGEPCVSQTIHLYKYRFVRELQDSLGNLMVKVMQKTNIPLPEIIIPIPLHPKRLRWRGFNQSELLANHLAENLLPEIKLNVNSNILFRNRYTPPQMQIKNHKNRRSNIEGAFSVKFAEQLKDKTCLLVDDITTTGSTIFECAKMLKLSGAKEVFAVVIARQDNR